jgi:5-methylcytosine-specific restriction enzyme B
LLSPKTPPHVLDSNREVINALEAFPRGGREAAFELVVFHPSYEYEQFIGGITAKASGEGKVRYEVEEGTFLRLCDAQRAVLVIDEINRGNLPKLLGELVYALEYRDSPVALPFERPGRSPGEDRMLKVPGELFVIATMNSSDRSIGHIDVAVRRRFALVPVEPDPAVVMAVWKERFGRGGEAFAGDLIGLMGRVNGVLGKDRQDGIHLGIGQSYFLPRDAPEDVDFETAQSTVRNRWEYQVRPLLDEYEVMAGVDVVEYREDLDELIKKPQENKPAEPS